MRERTQRRRGGRWAAGAIAVVAALGLSSCLSGPIDGTPSVAVGIDVTKVGYQQSEFFLGGLAVAYTPKAPLTSDGRWSAAIDPATSGQLFKTRVVVERPADPAAFNGTVVVEWMNVTAGLDLPNDWILTHNEIIRSGAAWVGVSAQTVGVNQLKSCCAARYGSLVHPGDSYSYDIFTTAAREARANPDLLGGLVPERILAMGESQSASRLVTYINAVHPLTHAYDGFLVHSRGGAGSALSQAPLAAVPTPSPSLIRDDLDEPVFVVQAETDVIGSNLAVRQPDTDTFREWELAGTSHADAYMAGVGFSDLGDGAGATAMFARMRDPGPPPGGCASPTNAGGQHWLLQAALHHLDAWVRTGTPPPPGDLLEVASSSPVVLVRDAQGNALGGVRSPQVDAPVATLTGINSGPGLCRLFGSTAPLSAAQLEALYPNHAAFVAAWAGSLARLQQEGFLLPADVAELLASGVNASIP